MNNMKKFLALMIIFTVLISPVLGLKGVGIKYGIEYTQIDEGKETCLSYGVYNPWDENVVAELTADDELEQFIKKVNNKRIPAGTNSGDAIKIKVCFDVPKGTLDSCDEPRVFEGTVVAREQKDTLIGGSGSATSTLVSAPLTLEVRCGEGVTGAAVAGTLGGGFGIGALLIGLLAVLSYGISRVKLRRGPEDHSIEEHTMREIYMQKYNELMVLHVRIKAGESNPEILRQYHSLREYLERLRTDM
jgi:hypothetical protein